MNNDLIKKDYFKKINLIQKYNEYYYNKNKTIISDQEFDTLKKFCLTLLLALMI